MLFYILFNSSGEIVLKPLIMILLIQISSITSLFPFSLLFWDLLLLLVAMKILFLQLGQSGGGCLIGTWLCTSFRLLGLLFMLVLPKFIKGGCWLVLSLGLVAELLGCSISMGSASQSKALHQHLSYFLMHIAQYSPMTFFCHPSGTLCSVSLGDNVAAKFGPVKNLGA